MKTNIFRTSEFIISANTEFEAYELAKEHDEDHLCAYTYIQNRTVNLNSLKDEIIYKKLSAEKIAPDSYYSNPKVITFVRLT